MTFEFKLPEMGEGVESGDVVRVLVTEGESIEENQPVVELETEKALLEVPSPAAGVVEKVHIKEGDTVLVGALLLTLEAADPAAEAMPDAPSLVPAPAPEEEVASEPSPGAASVDTARAQVELLPKPQYEPSGAVTPAGPATRRMARELGVDLRLVEGSGPGGRIVEEDVKAYTQQALAGQAPSTAARSAHSPPPPPLPDFSKWGEVERQRLSTVRRKTAEHMSLAWSVIPHVTQFETVDITELEAFRKRYAEEAAEQGGKLTLTVLALKVAAQALHLFPNFNSSIDLEAGELVLKRYCHIGIAVDTERGLLAPVIRDVDKKSMMELARELVELSGRTRAGKVELEELQGGTFTISNQGGIGGAGFTPIINYPEVAILALGRARIEPGYPPAAGVAPGMTESAPPPEPRLMLPIAVSYDHRAIDGAQAARFIQYLKDTLQDPMHLLLGI